MLHEQGVKKTASSHGRFARLRRQIWPLLRCTRLIVAVLLLLGEVAVVVLAAVLFYRYREKIEETDHKGPYVRVGLANLGRTNVTYSRTLPDGTSITINNRHATFLAEVENDRTYTDLLFPTFRDALAFARAKNLPLLPSVSMIHHRFKIETDRLFQTLQFAANAYADRRFGGYPFQLGANRMNEIIDALRRGEMDPSPTQTNDWHDYQLYALIPLIRSDHSFALATQKLIASEEYRQFMEDTFRGTAAADRESHVMRITTYVRVDQYSGLMEIQPWFSCEPMPAVYYRLSRAYHFLRGQAEQNKSPETEIQGRRITDVLEELERTALALTALSLLELGIPPDGLLTTPLPQGFPQSLQSTAERWLRALPDDPALALDKRFAADVNSGRKWANVGVRLQRLRYMYEHPPTVNGRAVIGKPVSYYAPVSVFAEFARPIPEGPFGEFCDRHKTISGCLSALGARKGKAEGKYISIQTLLGFLATCVSLDIALFILGLRRRRLALGHSAVWWAAALVVTLLAATSLGRTVVLLHLAPRFALPRAPLLWIT